MGIAVSIYFFWLGRSGAPDYLSHFGWDFYSIHFVFALLPFGLEHNRISIYFPPLWVGILNPSCFLCTPPLWVGDIYRKPNA